MNSKVLLATSGLFLLSAPTVTVAQQADLFARDRNVAVTQRGRPELEALGIRAGTLMVYPKLQGDVGYDSNVRADANGEVSDSYVRFTPSVDVESDWSRQSDSTSTDGVNLT